MTLIEIGDRKNTDRNLRRLLIRVYLRNLRRDLFLFLPPLLPPFLRVSKVLVFSSLFWCHKEDIIGRV